MRLNFNGAARTVTGSQFLLEVNGARILLECGLFQGHRVDTYENNRNFPFDVSKIDCVLLSHAHIDHSGNLPNLVKQGYDRPIFANPATARLADYMLQDSGKIHEYDAEYVNKKRVKRGEEPIEPLYTIADAERVTPLFQPKEYGQIFEAAPGVAVHFVDAGHILGSASIVLDIEENGQKFRLWFSGDIGRKNLALINDPVLPVDADFMIMECTYGDKPHRDPQSAYIELRDTLNRTLERGGKVIIPAFAVGRTQEIVYSINKMISNGEVPEVPVFVDSPLAARTTRVFQEFANTFDQETQEFVLSGRHPALSFPQLTYIEDVQESKALNDRRDPMIIIAASGMAEAGRVLHHLRNNVENPRNTVLIVSWQAPHTLGRRLADREHTVRIFGQLHDRRAEVVTIGGYSAHAGQNGLLEYVASTQSSLKKLWLVHGEPDAAGALTEKLNQAGFSNLEYPAQGTMVEI
jgi:metallo-beta-lactamase family protein